MHVQDINLRSKKEVKTARAIFNFGRGFAILHFGFDFRLVCN